MSNCSGYPLSLIAQYTLAHMLGYNPEALEFRKIDRVYGKLQGVYETFKGTMRLTIRRRAGTLVVEYRDRLVTPSPHPQRPGSKPGLSERFVGFPLGSALLIPLSDSPFLGHHLSGPGGLGSSGFTGGSLPTLAPLHPLLVSVQILNLFSL
jgi:hypothetical protein